MVKSSPGEDYGPWNPGLSSAIPRNYLHLSTMFRPQNVSTSLQQASELKDFCGIEAHELVAFRPERLLVHETLIRVTADLVVYEGRKTEDLGINFRDMVDAIIKRHLAHETESLIAVVEKARTQAVAAIDHHLRQGLYEEPSTDGEGSSTSLWRRWLGHNEDQARGAHRASSEAERLAAVLSRWEEHERSTSDDCERACLAALARVVTAVAGRHGRIIGNRELIASIAVNLVMNDYGSEVLGQALQPHFRKAAEAEGFRLLPAQDQPVVMNTKGASASGKSTMRPLQHQLADRIGVSWDDFALISPDIWRKYLLDYDSLGEAYKYAGMLTGHEIDFIDRKLDRYMAGKGAQGDMPHLLIDRFRFDSFSPEAEAAEADEPVRLLTRFGDLVYMFFMITPPSETVVRAWRRGLMVGRYKAVDDLLAHNVEAYSGMPNLFFTWAQRSDKRLHFEFLDNSVPQGQLPRTVAFGWNGELNILDISRLLDVDRFRKVNLNARAPEDVHQHAAMADEQNLDFLRKCAELIPVLNFVDQYSGRIFARLEGWQWHWCDPPLLRHALATMRGGRHCRRLACPRTSSTGRLEPTASGGGSSDRTRTQSGPGDPMSSHRFPGVLQASTLNRKRRYAGAAARSVSSLLSEARSFTLRAVAFRHRSRILNRVAHCCVQQCHARPSSKTIR